MAELLTARGCVDSLDKQAHPMVRMFSPDNDAFLEGDSVLIRTAGTAESWFREHEGELQHLPWPAQLPHLDIAEPV
jgi:hypothetical protein